MPPAHSTTVATHRCRQCSARIPAGTPDGLCPWCIPEDALPAEDVRLLGDCELYEEIGRGGMGVVWRGRQRGLDREVAVKTLPGGDLAGVEARARFRTEALAAARLKHPNIVTVYDVGEEDGMPFLVMELVHGSPLSARIAHGPVPARLAAQWLRDAALAVHHAHTQGVLHRDLKPSNIFLEAGEHGDRPRVMDFGLAKLTDSDHSLTLSGSAMGSPAFMPPEQTRGEDSTAQSDVYGLGGVLYSALTGRPPFHGESLATILAQVQQQETVAPRRLNASVPPDLETICLKCLEKSPQRRYASAVEVAEDLTRFLEGRPVLARPVGWPVKLARMARRHPWRAVAVLMAAAMIGGLILTLLWRAEAERRYARDVGAEKAATQLALVRSRVDGARSVIRLQQVDSRPRALGMMRSVLATAMPDALRAEVVDTSLAAAALPMARLLPLPGESTLTEDWTMSAADERLDVRAFADFRGKVEMRSLSGTELITSFSTAPRRITVVLAISPGGRWLAIRHRGELAIWEPGGRPESGPVFVAEAWPQGRRFALGHVAFAPDDSAVLWSDGAAVVATALPAGTTLGRWSMEGSGPQQAGALAFDPEGKWFAVASSGAPEVEVRAWPSGAVQRRFVRQLLQPAIAIALTSQGKWIAAGDEAGRVSVWRGDDDSADRHIDFHGHTDSLRGLTFSPDGRLLASSSDDATLRVWNVQEEAAVASLSWDCGTPSFGREGRTLAAGLSDGRLTRVELESSAILRSFRPEAGSRRPQHISLFPDSQSLLCVSAAGVEQWALPDGPVVRRYAAADLDTALAGPDGMTVYGGGNTELLAWSPGGPAAGRTVLPASDTGWPGTTISADGRIIGVWGRSPGGVFLHAADSTVLRAYELPGGHLDCALSPDGSVAAASLRYEPGVVVLDTASGAVLRTLDLPPGHPLAWSPDGKWLAACGVRPTLWDTATWEARPLPDVAPGLPATGAVAIARPESGGTSRLLAMASGGHRIALIALPECRLIAHLESPGGLPLYDVEFSRDHRWLVAGAARGEVQVWDLTAVRAHLAESGVTW